MNVIYHKYQNLWHRSLFSLFTQEVTESLLADAEIHSLQKGDRIPRSQPKNELFIVLEGEVAIWSRQSPIVECGSIIAGRSIELRSVIHGANMWQFDWVASGPTVVIKVPWPKLFTALNDVGQIEYLKRITQGVELQKMRRDLRSFGISQTALIEILQNLKPESFENVFADWSQRAFVVISDGEISLKSTVEGRRIPIATFQSGDNCILDLPNNDYIVDADPKGRAWVIRQSEIDQLPSATEINRLLSLFDFDQSKVRDESRFEVGQDKVGIEHAEVKDSKEDKLDHLIDETYRKQSKFARNLFRWLNPFPVHSQQDPSFAGAACVSSLATYFGYKIGMHAIMKEMPQLRGGTQFLQLQAGSQNLGFRTFKKYLALKALASSTIPAVLAFEGRFVVFYGVTAKGIRIGDPELGRCRTIAIAEFRSKWQGQALFLVPSENLVNRPDPELRLLALLKSTAQAKYPLVLFAIGGFLTFLMALAIPVINQFLFDRVVISKNQTLLLAAVFAALVTKLTGAILDWIQNTLSSNISSVVEANLVSVLLSYLSRVPLRFFQTLTVGDLLSRFEEVKAIRDYLSRRVFTGLFQAMAMAICAVVLWLYNPALMFIAFATVPVQIILVLLTASHLHSLKTRVAQLRSREQALIFEHFNHIQTLKSVGGFLPARWRWESAVIQADQSQYKLNLTQSIFQGLAFLCEQGMAIITLSVAAYFFFNDQLTLGQVIATSFITTLLAEPIRSLVAMIYEWPQVRASIQRLTHVFAQKTSSQASTGDEDRPFLGKITFDRVSFKGGPDPSPNILDQISFSIEPGEVVAVVGASGAGKSTIVNLLMRFIDTTAGRILIDDFEIQKLSVGRVRKQLGLVEQEGYLYGESILDNLTLGKAQVPLAEVSEALHVADADEFIARIPGGVSSRLKERGAGLSEGQAQRIRLARTLLRNPSLLILDEATSHLDSISEERVITRMLRKYKGKTVLFVTHRANLANRANRILVIDQGRVAEFGTHQDLIHQRGRYYDMFCKQVA